MRKSKIFQNSEKILENIENRALWMPEQHESAILCCGSFSQPAIKLLTVSRATAIKKFKDNKNNKLLLHAAHASHFRLPLELHLKGYQGLLPGGGIR